MRQHFAATKFFCNLCPPPIFLYKAPSEAKYLPTYLPTLRRKAAQRETRLSQKVKKNKTNMRTPMRLSLYTATPTPAARAQAVTATAPSRQATSPRTEKSPPCAIQLAGPARPMPLSLHTAPPTPAPHAQAATATCDSASAPAAQARALVKVPLAPCNQQAPPRRTPGAAPCTRVGALPATPGRPAKSTPQEQPSNWPQSPLHPALTRG